MNALEQTLAVANDNKHLPTRARGNSTVGAARETLEKNANNAAQTLADLSTDPKVYPEHRITASKAILSAVGLEKQSSVQNAVTVPVEFLGAAFAAMSALAGLDVSKFGDMTDLTDRLEDMKLAMPLDTDDE